MVCVCLGGGWGLGVLELLLEGGGGFGGWESLGGVCRCEVAAIDPRVFQLPFKWMRFLV